MLAATILEMEGKKLNILKYSQTAMANKFKFLYCNFLKCREKA